MFCYPNPPRLYGKVAGIINGIDVVLIQSIADTMNARLKILSIPNHDSEAIFLESLGSSILDLTINTHIRFTSKDVSKIEALNLFEVDGLCAIIPIPTRKSFFDLLLEPFEFLLGL